MHSLLSFILDFPIHLITQKNSDLLSKFQVGAGEDGECDGPQHGRLGVR